MVGPLAYSTHEAPSLRESGEQDQCQKNEPHIHTVSADAHGLYRKQITSDSLLIGECLAITDQTLSNEQLQRPGTKGVKSPSQFLGQNPTPTSVE